MDLTISKKNVYVVSDIHNDADGFKKLLKIIDFSDADILIIDGDLFDRGEKPVELYFEILKYPNIYVVLGNHDVWVAREIREKFAGETVGEYIRYNTVSIMERRLTPVDLLELAKWLGEKPYFINLTLDGEHFKIAHAQTFPTPERIFDNKKFYMGEEFHYEDFLKGANEPPEYISVVGHKPTDNRRIRTSASGRTIRIDCGNGYPDGTLGAIRLNDRAEFYVS